MRSAGAVRGGGDPGDGLRPEYAGRGEGNLVYAYDAENMARVGETAGGHDDEGDPADEARRERVVAPRGYPCEPAEYPLGADGDAVPCA